MTLATDNSSTSMVCPSMLDLKDIHVAELKNGTFCYVLTGVPSSPDGNSLYILDKELGLPEDLVTGNIVVPGPGSPISGVPLANWVRAQ